MAPPPLRRWPARAGGGASSIRRVSRTASRSTRISIAWNLITSPLQAGCSTGILVMTLEVKLPINLNNELGLGAIEVDGVGVHSPLRPSGPPPPRGGRGFQLSAWHGLRVPLR